MGLKEVSRKWLVGAKDRPPWVYLPQPNIIFVIIYFSMDKILGSIFLHMESVNYILYILRVQDEISLHVEKSFFYWCSPISEPKRKLPASQSEVLFL